MKKLLCVTLLLLSNVANAAIIFSEDFENGLLFGAGNNWVSNISGAIVVDPLQGDKALSFRSLIGGGDLFSKTLTSTTGKFFISFDYLGTCQTNNCGGFFGNSITQWVGTTAPYPDLLVDNGQWNTYTFEVTGNSMYLFLEDWVGSGGTVGDVFFDNIIVRDSLASVSEPATLGMLSMMLLLAFRRVASR
ncbi:hypothetical protein [Alteromonas facilis]|uniref:hypothetical protein n=1 Tax=Alteromonas facilis TaxID=2048004 RepID=UPI000C292940|nr:hypothetical protein [Alteromonas facilis]